MRPISGHSAYVMAGAWHIDHRSPDSHPALLLFLGACCVPSVCGCLLLHSQWVSLPDPQGHWGMFESLMPRIAPQLSPGEP